MDNFQRLGVAEDKVSEQEIAEDVLRFRCLKETQKKDTCQRPGIFTTDINCSLQRMCCDFPA